MCPSWLCSCGHWSYRHTVIIATEAVLQIVFKSCALIELITALVKLIQYTIEASHLCHLFTAHINCTSLLDWALLHVFGHWLWICSVWWAVAWVAPHTRTVIQLLDLAVWVCHLFRTDSSYSVSHLNGCHQAHVSDALSTLEEVFLEQDSLFGVELPGWEDWVHLRAGAVFFVNGSCLLLILAFFSIRG